MSTKMRERRVRKNSVSKNFLSIGTYYTYVTCKSAMENVILIFGLVEVSKKTFLTCDDGVYLWKEKKSQPA